MATVLQTFRMRAKEGQVDEAREVVARAKELYSSRGASSVRAFWAIDAGVHSGDVVLAVEYGSAAAWAANVDSEDDEMKNLRNYLANAEGPLDNSEASLLREIEI